MIIATVQILIPKALSIHVFYYASGISKRY